MSKKKTSQPAPEKKKQVNYQKKTSYECQQYNHQCEAGLSYIKNMIPGKSYSGVVCKHV